MSPKLAIVTSHPIQYYAPWFRYIVENTDIELRVFYLWDFGVSDQEDPEFKAAVKWDVPLLEGYDCEFVPNTSSRPGTDHFGGLNNPSLAQRIKEYAPDAILMMIYNYRACMEFLMKWNRRKAPLVFRGDSHRLIPREGWKEGIRKQLIRSLYSRFDALLYVGQANREYYRMHGVKEEKLFFSPHAVDNQRFTSSQAGEAARQAEEWRDELRIPREAKVVLFAGKFIEKKRPLDLLRAFKKAGTDAHLLMVGSGDLEDQLRDEAENHTRIHFAPFQNQSQMPRTYAAADLIVLPSYGLGETWGLAINEAMCLSRAVGVSSHVGCSRDIVRERENGFVFEAGKVEQLVEKLRFAMESKDRLKSWGAASRRIIDGYSYRQTTDGLNEALMAIVKPDSRSANVHVQREKAVER